MKYAIASLNPTIGAWSAQLNTIRLILEKARDRKVDLVVLPELSLGAPDAGDLYLRPQTAQFIMDALKEMVSMTKGMTVVCGTPFLHDDSLYNAAVVFYDGLLKAIIPKRYASSHTPEDRWFARWDYSQPSKIHFGATIGNWKCDIPGYDNLVVCCGDLSCWPEIESGALCVQVCNRPFALSSYRDELSKHLAFSRQNDLTLIRANLLGCDDGTHLYDGGGYILNNGKIMTLSPRFGFDEFVLTTSDDPIPEAFDPSLAQFIEAGTCPNSEEDYHYAELELSLCLGLNDYLVRSHSTRWCLALSGGRDSAMIAVLVARLAALKYPKDSASQRRERIHDLLVCAYLPSRASSSSATEKAAVALGEKFGFECAIIPIADIAAQNIAAIEAVLGRKLTWETDDLTLQNVQARTRSTIIWTLANAHNALLLTTGNMSEAAVGYATMDGDTSGCLDPIGNVPKTMVSAWLEWARHFHNIPELDLVFSQPPSAELRPIETQQADEKDLMPYPVLDAFIEWFHVNRHSPREMLELSRQYLSIYYDNDEDIRRAIALFVTKTVRAHWKRVREANSFRVMPYDLDPNSGLQWPCLQDAFSQALDEIR